MHPLTLPVASGLMILAAATNLLAYALGRPNAQGTGRMHPALQRSTSAMLALAAWAFVGLGATSQLTAPYARWVALGMSLSFIADLIMAAMLKVPNRVLGGMAVFGLAHLAYLAGFLGLNNALALAVGPAMLGGVATALLIACGTWWFSVDAPQAPRFLRFGALGYLVLLATMLGVACGLTSRAPQLGSLAAGACLFGLSDAILGNQILRQHHWPGVSDVVWASYIVGQAGIVWSVYPALLMG